MIHNALKCLPLPVYGDGQQVREWLHVDDHCAGPRAVLDRGQVRETYNIGAPRAHQYAGGAYDLQRARRAGAAPGARKYGTS